MRLLRLFAVVLVVGVGAVSLVRAQTAPPEDEVIEKFVRVALYSDDIESRRRILDVLQKRGRTDVVAALIDAIRFIDDEEGLIAATLNALTGQTFGDDWFKWMEWQEAHPEVRPFAGYDGLKADIMAAIDPEFRIFLSRGVKHEIRLEEIAWGGVAKDGIPSLDDPKLIDATEASYLLPDDLVFGVEINGDARAYPLRILNWHEMFNDTIGGVPLALAYCTLCGSGILFETAVAGRATPFVFGSSGFLYRSNKLMYDDETHSLWNQFTGRPVVGPLTGSGVELKIRPVTIASWEAWRKRHPTTRVLSLETGHRRDYGSGVAYRTYFASPNLMFPAVVEDKRLKPKDHVFVLRAGNDEKGYAVAAFAGGKVVNDRIGALDVVLVGEAATRTVRAYRAGGRSFRAGDADLATLAAADGSTWQVTESGLAGPGGATLERLPGHIAFWFAWAGYKKGKPLYGE